MSITIPDDYPTNLNTEDLLEQIKIFQKKINDSYESNLHTRVTYWKGLADIGLNELIRRNLERQIEENKKSKRTNYWLNGITILLAIITSIVGYRTLQYSYTDQVSDELWKQEQIETLKTNNEELKEINENLKQIILVQPSDSTSQ